MMEGLYDDWSKQSVAKGGDFHPSPQFTIYLLQYLSATTQMYVNVIVSMCQYIPFPFIA